ncbi:MAG TPA: TonB-dependent receptor [Ignavibacteriaceae bacterium]|nr:TonB-dependent receptor [Ignavibacteriaceae bacterium]
MKFLIILFMIFTFCVNAQSINIHGFVMDAETNLPLKDANVVLISEKFFGDVTDVNGEFRFVADVNPNDKLVISYVGFETVEYRISELNHIPSVPDSDGGVVYYFYLNKKIIPSQTVLIEASVGRKGITPLAFDNVIRKDIEENYTVYDLPKYLSDLPSTTFYSESGNAIGYNYLSIRGFDQRRITVSVNGIPQNDPEDHNVYWLDFPDLLESTELIQVQRGAGSGVFGYPAIGGSINLITSTFTNKPQIKLSAAYGSYVTRKYSASFSSGLIDGKYSVYAKLGQILSSGYKEKSRVNFRNYFLSAVRYDENFTTQFNFYGGPIADGLAYTGVAKFAVENKELRKQNYSYWEEDENGYIFTLERRPEEIENFSQPHFELLNEWQMTSDLKFNSALFLVLGEGFFDYDGSWSVFYDDYFRLKENGFDTSFIPSNALIRAKVENEQYGWIPRFSLDHNNGTLFFGAEFRKHNSLHWGSINYAENIPPEVTKEYKYYSYKGSKDIYSLFVNESYTLNDNWNLLGELQLAYYQYRLFEEKYIGTDFTVNNLFVNPRIGVNYKPFDLLNVYFSFARVSREPRLKEYYDAAESSAGEVPQFEINNDGTFNFDEPLVKPETMNDFELGASLNDEFYSVTLNLFYMLFNDEIVKNGQVDRFGQPVTGNVESSVHLGAELSAILKFWQNRFELFGNATLSKNTIEEGKFFIDEINFIDISGNRITGFPDFLTNFGLTFKDMGFYFRLSGKFVGKFYSDNYDEKLNVYLNSFSGFVDYKDNVNEAYFTSDFFASYEFNLLESLTPWKIYLQINNIFDNLYSAYAIGKEFFPAAERNWLAGIQVGL